MRTSDLPVSLECSTPTPAITKPKKFTKVFGQGTNLGRTESPAQLSCLPNSIGIGAIPSRVRIYRRYTIELINYIPLLGQIIFFYDDLKLLCVTDYTPPK